MITNEGYKCVHIFGNLPIIAGLYDTGRSRGLSVRNLGGIIAASIRERLGRSGHCWVTWAIALTLKI